MSNCNRHSPQSMMGLGSCAACAFDAMQGRIADLECDRGNLLNRVANLLDMVDELKSMKHDLERLLAAAQPTAQQVDDARDAARYRHMRARAKFMYRNGPGLYWYLPWNLKGNEGEQLDHTIDAALQAEKENGNE